MRIEAWLSISVLVGGALVSAIVATARPPLEVREQASPPPLAPVSRVEARDVQVVVRSQGTVEPRIEIDLAAEVSGRVVQVASALVAGGRFGAGDLLVEIDPRDAQVALVEADARVERASVEVHRARVALERLRALEGGSVASAAAREDAEFALQLARAVQREALAAEARAQRALDLTRVTAPFAGRVRSARIDPAQYVRAGESLARVYALGDVEVRLAITERELSLLSLPAPGLGEDRSGEALPRVRFSAPGVHGDRTWTGRVLRTEAEIDRQSRMIHAVARVEVGSAESESALPPVGLFVDAEIHARPLEHVYPLPRIAVRDGSRVLVVDADGRVEARRVEVARFEREQALVVSGLREGDRVCVSPTPPSVGAIVRPMDVDAS
jgi:RND family efflux transporter MFP subunit